MKIYHVYTAKTTREIFEFNYKNKLSIFEIDPKAFKFKITTKICLISQINLFQFI